MHGESGWYLDARAGPLAMRLPHLRDDAEALARTDTRIREVVRDWDCLVQAQNYARLFNSSLAGARG